MRTSELDLRILESRLAVNKKRSGCPKRGEIIFLHFGRSDIEWGKRGENSVSEKRSLAAKNKMRRPAALRPVSKMIVKSLRAFGSRAPEGRRVLATNLITAPGKIFFGVS